MTEHSGRQNNITKQRSPIRTTTTTDAQPHSPTCEATSAASSIVDVILHEGVRQRSCDGFVCATDSSVQQTCVRNSINCGETIGRRNMQKNLPSVSLKGHHFQLTRSLSLYLEVIMWALGYGIQRSDFYISHARELHRDLHQQNPMFQMEYWKYQLCFVCTGSSACGNPLGSVDISRIFTGCSDVGRSIHRRRHIFGSRGRSAP